jgi:molybdopterin/thiamine biosynthesis adenylyltransferase
MKKYKPYLNRVDLVKNQVEREELQEQEAKRKRSRSIQEQNRQRWLKYQEQLRSELAARYFHAVQSTGGAESFSNKFSVAFDGTDDHIDLGASSTVADGGQFSFSFWIKGKAAASGGQTYLFSADYYNLHTFWNI